MYQTTFPHKVLALKSIILPVHPLSRRILFSEYGLEFPIFIRPHDILFSMLSITRLRDRTNLVRLRALLTTEIEIAIDGAMAAHIAKRCYQAGHHLYRWHKDMICRYVDTCLRRGMPAMSALREFYEIHGIGEDDFPLENAWKMWQRHNKEVFKKNPVFSSGIRGNTSVLFCQKIGRPRKIELPVSDDDIQAMSSRLVDIAASCLPNPPKALHTHAQCYFYIHLARRRHEDVASMMNIPVRSLYRKAKVVKDWRDTDPTFRALLSQVCDLPQK